MVSTSPFKTGWIMVVSCMVIILHVAIIIMMISSILTTRMSRSSWLWISMPLALSLLFQVGLSLALEDKFVLATANVGIMTSLKKLVWFYMLISMTLRFLVYLPLCASCWEWKTCLHSFELLLSTRQWCNHPFWIYPSIWVQKVRSLWFSCSLVGISNGVT